MYTNKLELRPAEECKISQLDHVQLQDNVSHAMHTSVDDATPAVGTYEYRNQLCICKPARKSVCSILNLTYRNPQTRE